MGARAAKTAFVTGATGFVGLNLVEALVAEGWGVTALHRSSSDITELARFPVERAAGDVTDRAAVERAMPPEVDAVFHVAADLNMWSRRNAAQTATNVDGTRNVVEAALARRARRLVLTSSISAFGRQPGPISEDTPSSAPDSRVNYERTKWLAEQEVRKGIERGLQAVIVNPCAVLGPRDRHGWAQMFFLIRDGKARLLPPGTAVFNHVREVAKAHVAAAVRGRSGENYILTGDTAPFADMMRAMAGIMGVKLTAPVAPAPVMRLMGCLGGAVAAITGKPPEISPEMAALMCMHLACDTDKAERELGYRPVPLATCIEDSYRWLREARLL